MILPCNAASGGRLQGLTRMLAVKCLQIPDTAFDARADIIYLPSQTFSGGHNTNNVGGELDGSIKWCADARLPYSLLSAAELWRHACSMKEGQCRPELRRCRPVSARQQEMLHGSKTTAVDAEIHCLLMKPVSQSPQRMTARFWPAGGSVPIERNALLPWARHGRSCSRRRSRNSGGR